MPVPEITIFTKLMDWLWIPMAGAITSAAWWHIKVDRENHKSLDTKISGINTDMANHKQHVAETHATNEDVLEVKNMVRDIHNHLLSTK